MRKILTARQMRECDHSTIAHGTPSSVLMQRAAHAIFEALIKNFDTTNTLVVCGSGNNGGDGFLVALYLKRAGYSCDVWYVGEGHSMTEETDRRYNEALDEEISFTEDPVLSEYTAVVDAILGTGLSFAPSGLAKTAIDRINASGVPVISVDIPSGISSDTGEASGAFVQAEMTVTMQAYKRGHAQNKGIDASGKIMCAELGIDTSYATDSDGMMPLVIEEKDLYLIPKRKRSAHKGTFGRVLVIAGSYGMCGAAYLSAAAAYRSGAGIVEVFTPECNRSVLQILLPEAIVTSYDPKSLDTDILYEAVERASCIVIGPGIGTGECAKSLVKEVFKYSDSPLIVDADALNVIANEALSFPKDVPVIITPHPGELSRLTGRSVKELSCDTWGSAAVFARENDIICVSKFARTVVTDGDKIFVNMSGGPSLAKGGSGDVLTGVIAGMLSSGLSPMDAASVGVYVHGRAGDISAERLGDYSSLARDVIEAVPHVLKKAGGKE